MSLTSDYEAETHAKGWVFLLQLPGNIPNHPDWKGAPGRRLTVWNQNVTPWKVVSSQYEIAPLSVRLEQGFTNSVSSWVAQDGLDAVSLSETLSSAGTKIVEATGLDAGVPGVVAKALGVSPVTILVVLLIVGYLMLRNQRLVPSLKKVLD